MMSREGPYDSPDEDEDGDPGGGPGKGDGRSRQDPSGGRGRHQASVHDLVATTAGHVTTMAPRDRSLSEPEEPVDPVHDEEEEDEEEEESEESPGIPPYALATNLEAELPAGRSSEDMKISRPLEKADLEEHNKVIYRIRIDGCQYGMMWEGLHLKKSWTILTTSKSLWLTLNKRCDGAHIHGECRGKAAQASSYYPKKMCEAVLKAMNYQWHTEDMGMVHLVEQHLLQVPHEDQMAMEDNVKVGQVMALSRTKLQTEAAEHQGMLE